MESIATQEFGNTSVAAWTSELGKLPLAVEAHFVFETTCDSEAWLAKVGIPAITVELTTHEDVEWEKNLAGIKSIFEYYR
jgi:hypothetical protein